MLDPFTLFNLMRFTLSFERDEIKLERLVTAEGGPCTVTVSNRRTKRASGGGKG
jgi:hypothetical protein